MFLILSKDEKNNGAFSITNKQNQRVILFFEQYDDADRYKMMLEEQNFPEMEIVEYDDQLLINTANAVGYNYSVIGSYDLVVPPNMYESL